MTDDKNTKTTADEVNSILEEARKNFQVREEVNSILEEARKNFQAKKYLNTLALCLKAGRLDPGNLDVDWLLAMTHFEKGTLETEWDTNDTITACKYFEYLAKRDPGRRALAYLYHGIAIVRWGNNYNNYIAAIESFDKVLELEPGNELAAKFRDLCRKCMEGHTAETHNERTALLNSIQAD